MRAVIVGVAASCALLAGCAGPKDSVVFVTKTSFGLDVEQSPPSVSVAHDRVEGYFGHRFDNGTAPPVAAGYFTDGGLFDRQIQQVYATGRAAQLVTRAQNITPATADDFSGDTKPMFFATSSVLGMKVGYGDALNSVEFGWKRKEASIIPITRTLKDGTIKASVNFPSVLAFVDTDSKWQKPTEEGTKTGIRQFFATGSAAEAMASNSMIQGVFEQQALDAVAKYRDEERAQSAAVLDTLTCLSQLGDDKLAQVWKNAEDLDLFMNKASYPALRSQAAATARATYTRQIAVVNPASARYSGLLTGHRTFVCALRS